MVIIRHCHLAPFSSSLLHGMAVLSPLSWPLGPKGWVVMEYGQVPLSCSCKELQWGHCLPLWCPVSLPMTWSTRIVLEMKAQLSGRGFWGAGSCLSLKCHRSSRRGLLKASRRISMWSLYRQHWRGSAGSLVTGQLVVEMAWPSCPFAGIRLGASTWTTAVKRPADTCLGTFVITSPWPSSLRCCPSLLSDPLTVPKRSWGHSVCYEVELRFSGARVVPRTAPSFVLELFLVSSGVSLLLPQWWWLSPCYWSWGWQMPKHYL